jgi:hypothetical protein
VECEWEAVCVGREGEFGVGADGWVVGVVAAVVAVEVGWRAGAGEEDEVE